MNNESLSEIASAPAEVVPDGSQDTVDSGETLTINTEFVPVEIESVESQTRDTERVPEELEAVSNPSSDEDPELASVSESERIQKEISLLTESVDGTMKEINSIRASLGLPPEESLPYSVQSEQEQVDQLKATQGELDAKKEELVTAEEKEQLIREAKEQIMMQISHALSAEFGGFSPDEIRSILESGLHQNGTAVQSRMLGDLSPEVARSLSRGFSQGGASLLESLSDFPEILERIDAEITAITEARVESQLTLQKKEMEDVSEKRNDEPVDALSSQEESVIENDVAVPENDEQEVVGQVEQSSPRE